MLLKNSGHIYTFLRQIQLSGIILADHFVIQKCLEAWRWQWDNLMLEVIQSNSWTSSVRLPNSAKSYSATISWSPLFEPLMLSVMRMECHMRVKKGLSGGLSLNSNGGWEERQLKPKLQNIIIKYRHELESGRRQWYPEMNKQDIIKKWQVGDFSVFWNTTVSLTDTN